MPNKLSIRSLKNLEGVDPRLAGVVKRAIEITKVDFGVTEGLIPPDFYASIVLAILMSTIVSPLLLRSTLALFPYEPKQLLDDEVQATDCLEEIKIPSS